MSTDIPIVDPKPISFAPDPQGERSEATLGRVFRILVIGDTHYKTKNILETTEFEQKLFAYLDHLGTNPDRATYLDFIVCTGDMLNDHETVHSDPLRRTIALVHRLRRYAPVFVLVGNHDRPNNSNFLTDEHPFTAMKYWHYDNDHHPVTVVDHVTDRSIEDRRFIFVPYVPPGRFFDALHTIMPTEPDSTDDQDNADNRGERRRMDALMTDVTAVFSHQEFYGIPLSKDTVSTKGDRWPLDYPVVFNGHIHDYSQPQSNVYNVGTPFQQTFGERPDKTISMVTIAPDRTITHERVDLGLTKKITIQLGVDEIPTFQPPTGVHLKLVIVGEAAELKQAVRLHQIKALINQGIKVVYKDSGETGSRNKRTPPKLTVGQDGIQNNVSFARRLHQRISNDAALSKLFAELFGAPVVPPTSRLRLVVKEAGDASG